MHVIYAGLLPDPLSRCAGSLAGTVRAWRGITVRQWMWATAVALIILIVQSVGLLPPILRIVPAVARVNTTRKVIASHIFNRGLAGSHVV